MVRICALFCCFFLSFLVVFSLAFALPHDAYPSFAAPDNRGVLGSAFDSLSVSDAIVYRAAYYNLHGSDEWIPFSLGDNLYPNSDAWLQGTGSFYSLPDFPSGNESYILFYSCSLVDASWDCHGTDDHPNGYWQLLVVNYSLVDASAIFGNGPNELPTKVNSPPELDSLGASPPLPHSTFPSFASTESRVYSQDGLLASIVDLVTYKQAYYSDDGQTWQNKSLQGTVYEDDPDWIRADAVFIYPDSFSQPGDHYVAIYSCDRSFTWMDEPWDCHGAWQVIVVNGGATDAADPYANVHLTDDIRYCAGNHYDYQCGSIDLCGTTYTYDDCAAGYDCVDNLCIARSDLSCVGVACDADEYCARGVCLQSVPNSTYFVAPWGDDANPGTFDEPFYSWQRGAEELYPGDIVYIRGGVWYPTEYLYNSATIGLLLGPGGYANLRSGTRDNPLMIFNYPSEKPIMDGSLANTSDARWLSGIGIGGEHIHLRGLTLRHVHQSPPDFTHVKSYSEVSGIGSNGASHHFENVVVHDIDGRGFQHWSYAWRDEDAQYSYDRCIERETEDPDGDPAECEYQDPPYENDTTSWINCDAFNLFSRYESQPGNAADGWKVGTYYGSTFTWKGSRAWNYSDDGFDPHGSGLRIFDNSWASSMNNFASLTPMYGTEGNGFKTTGPEGISIPADEHNVIYKNCIAADNYGHGSGSGFIANLVTSDEYPSNPLVINTLSYKNGYGYWDLDGGTVRNNIAYATRNIGPIGEVVSITGSRDYLASNNTWYPTTGTGWPPQLINPAYNVTDDDFVSLDVTQLTRPRKPDGSLPDIEFGHLAEGSDLIDGGVVIPGYHCDTNGSHPGLDCVEWFGYAPDLGPFESLFSRAPPICGDGTCNGDETCATCEVDCGECPVEENCTDGILNNGELFTDCGGPNCAACECTGDVTESCSITNGVGERTRQCQDGNFLAWSDCTVLSCDTGYNINGSVCSPDVVVCESHAYTACHLDDLYWFNSCDEVEELNTDCTAQQTCSGGACVSSTPTGAIIADHTAADNFASIPSCWIEKAKQDFRIGYGHTSHGSQIASGIAGLNTILNNEGVYPQNLFSTHPSGYNGALLLFEGGSYNDGTWLAYDVGYGGWDTRTRTFLDSAEHGDKNVIMWSWCGQVNDVNLQTHYFDNMVALETEYPHVDFIYMTGHLESNEAVLSANNQIRAHVASRDGILFDFADIEKWDPTPQEHPLDTDACNWCSTWCSAQEDCTAILNAVSYCAHSHDYNCYRKAKAFWWMMARMAGWDGTAGDVCE